MQRMSQNTMAMIGVAVLGVAYLVTTGGKMPSLGGKARVTVPKKSSLGTTAKFTPAMASMD